jgi:hypothetical protein
VDATVLLIVRTAFTVLAARILTIFSLWMTFGLACWVMYNPSQERIAVAGGFAVLVYIPSVLRERKSHEGSKDQQEHGEA